MTDFKEVIENLEAEGVSLHSLTVHLLQRFESEQAERQAFLAAKAKRGVRPDRYVASAAVKRVQDRASKPHPRSGKELRRQAERRGLLVRGPSL